MSSPILPKFAFKSELKVDIVAGAPIERLVCSSPEVEPSYGVERTKAHLEVNERLEQDFCLIYRSKDVSEPKIYLQESLIYKNEKAALISFFPDFSPPPCDECSQDS